MPGENIQRIIFDALELINHARADDRQILISEDTLLFGNDGELDSMELVGLLISIEEALLDEGIEVTLSDDRAMSQSRSPFRSVKTLQNYIQDTINESVS
ncbi:hypothetical protein LPB19_11645 [Marinobacter salinisoli]|uniref:Carrier domain-containing protein n=1 Tax=Marinobacter salinisoli TaxID=2769486 RepID=A0ABX7MNQ9_9GAMM|nr:hypothetical protein [Marinobacter salinisoli]QSP93849.1 hypothetical protein LPB19_11645 [Marinobacter salinisoli]